MKKFLIVILFFSFCLSGCNNNETPVNNQSENNYTASRTTATDNTSDTNITSNIETNNTVINDITSTNNTETEISSFSTKIYTPDDEARQNNIRITCLKLDGTVVKAR